jgi:O-antigen/teichoic acid export membrane protein
VAATLIGSLDAILIYHYLGAAELAVYAFAMAPVAHAKALISPVTTLGVPKLAHQSSANISSVLTRRTVTATIFGAIIVVAYCILAYPFFYVFFPRYVEAIPYSQVYSLVLAIQASILLVSAAIDSRITLVPKSLLYLWNVPSIVLGLSAVFLIQYFGIWGAIIGQILGLGTTAIVSWYVWNKIKDKVHADAMN